MRRVERQGSAPAATRRHAPGHGGSGAAQTAGSRSPATLGYAARWTYITVQRAIRSGCREAGKVPCPAFGPGRPPLFHPPGQDMAVLPLNRTQPPRVRVGSDPVPLVLQVLVQAYGGARVHPLPPPVATIQDRRHLTPWLTRLQRFRQLPVGVDVVPRLATDRPPEGGRRGRGDRWLGGRYSSTLSIRGAPCPPTCTVPAGRRHPTFTLGRDEQSAVAVGDTGEVSLWFSPTCTQRL